MKKADQPRTPWHRSQGGFDIGTRPAVGGGVGLGFRWQEWEMESNKRFTISIRSPIHIPELDGYPTDVVNSILERCTEHEEMEKLSRRHMFCFRAVIICLFAGIFVLLVLMRKEYSGANGALFLAFAVTLLSLPGHMVLYRVRSAHLLRRLVLRELAARGTNSLPT